MFHGKIKKLKRIGHKINGVDKSISCNIPDEELEKICAKQISRLEFMRDFCEHLLEDIDYHIESYRDNKFTDKSHDLTNRYIEELDLCEKVACDECPRDKSKCLLYVNK